MKKITVVLLLVSLAEIILWLVQIPSETLWPIGMVARELWPWLIVLNFLGLFLAYYRLRWAMVIFTAALALSVWPLITIPGVERNMARQWAQQGFSPDNLTIPAALPFYWHTLTNIDLPNIPPNQLRSDIYFYKSPTSVGQEPLPIIVDIHGGWWQHGTASEDHTFASDMANHGYAVFTIDYRKAPTFQYPAQTQDVRDAMEWIFRNAPLYGADPSRIALVGRSAGGQLALLAAYTIKRIPIRAVVSLYGPTDLTEAYEDPPDVDPLDIRSKLRAYMGNDPGELPDAYRNASPTSHVEGDLPPTLLIQGEHDDIIQPRFARELQSALRKNGTKALLLKLPWSEHSFDFVHFGPGNRLALAYIDAFLKDVMTPWKTQPLTE